MIVKLLTEHHLEFLSFKGGCRSSSESKHVKMSHCWKSHALAHFLLSKLGSRKFNTTGLCDEGAGLVAVHKLVPLYSKILTWHPYVACVVIWVLTTGSTFM